jgi:peptidoglycan/xylan/chitin deacetylase (PgdA/CDA1 family)
MGQYYQKVLTKNLSPLLKSLGIDRLTKPFYSGKGQILMLHRLAPVTGKERIHNHLSLEISPEQLENIVDFFIRKKYDFINLDMLPIWLKDNHRTSNKFVIFTFDDGYKDNLDFAYPVFKKHNIPFTIYITCSFPDKYAIIWWYILEDLILRNNKIAYSFSIGSINMSCRNRTEKEIAFIYIRKLINRLCEKNLVEELTAFFSKFGFNIIDYNSRFVMDWNEISELSNDPLVTIGAHTLNHYNLLSLSEEHSFREILGSKTLIESKINNKINHFSYPFGKYGIREVEFVRKCNFLTATTCDNANIFYKHIDHQFTLPRISINALTTEKVLRLQVNGFYPFILHKFRRIVY